SSKGVVVSWPSCSSSRATFCSAWVSACWHSRVSATPCSKAPRDSSRLRLPLSRRSTRLCRAPSDCSKSIAVFLPDMGYLGSSNENRLNIIRAGGARSISPPYRARPGSEIAPQVLGQAQGDHRRGFRAQHPGPEARGSETTGYGLGSLVATEATLPPDQQGQGCPGGPLAQIGVGAVMPYQLEVCLRRCQPGRQRHGCVYLWDTAAPALCTGAGRHLLPVLLALVRALALQA